jgi:glycosyltransferase involved in cell wall biosynthesis
MEPKHIVIDARQYGTSSGRYVRNLLRELEFIDTYNEYSVLLLPKDLGDYNPTAPNFKKIDVSYRPFSFGEQIGSTKKILELKPDLVHFTFVQQPLKYREKKITTIHDLTALNINAGDRKLGKLTYAGKQTLYYQMVKSALEKSSQIIVPSKYVQKELVYLSRNSAPPITVTYESADRLGADAVAPRKTLSAPFILYVGRAQKHKNLDRLVDAFKKIQETSRDIEFVFVGKKDTAYLRLEKYIKTRGIEHVRLTGFVSDEELRWYYENAEAYVFPSLSEGFGLPALEAMVHGCPVVSSNATCLPEIYGDAAHYFDPEDVDDMAAKINDVLGNKKLRDSLIKKGHEQVKKYSWRKMAEQTLAVYNKALKNK